MAAFTRRAGPNRKLAATASLLTMLLVLLGGSSTAEAARCLGKNATIARGGGNGAIHGTKGPDVIFAGGGKDRVNGLGGNDRICGGPGRDAIVGGRGKDRLSGGGGADRVTGLRGSDTIDGGPGRDRLFGASGNDRLRGGGGSDLVDGGRGDEPKVSGGPGSYDNVLGGTGRDRVDGGPGRHDVASYVTTTGSLRLDLSAGVTSGAENERLRRFEDALGGSGDDALVGGGDSNRLDGGPGNDWLQAVGAADAAFGGPGSDACVGGFGAENSCGSAPGGGGAVVVELVKSIDASASLMIGGTGGSDQVTLWRSRGAYLVAVGGAPVVPGASACGYVNPQAIACYGRAARVQAALGFGNDALSVRGIPRGVDATVDGGPGSDRLTGGPGEDTLYAGDDRVGDRLVGRAGDDQIFGVNTAHPRKDSGAAKMVGGRGDDLLVGGQPCGGDRFVGGPGRNDSASFARIRNGGVDVKAKIGGTVSDPEAGRCQRGRISGSVEKIEGSPGRDRLIGDGTGNVLLGRGGPDVIDGKGGRDRCIGGARRDRTRGCEQRFR